MCYTLSLYIFFHIIEEHERGSKKKKYFVWTALFQHLAFCFFSLFVYLAMNLCLSRLYSQNNMKCDYERWKDNVVIICVCVCWDIFPKSEWCNILALIGQQNSFWLYLHTHSPCSCSYKWKKKRGKIYL